MAACFKFTGIITLAIGVQLIAPRIAGATTLLDTFSDIRFHPTATTNLTITFAADFQTSADKSSRKKDNERHTPPDKGGPDSSQTLPDKSSRKKNNERYTPPDKGGPSSSLGAGTR